MKQMTCPVNGTRPIVEFTCGGDLQSMPDPHCEDTVWADYIFNRNNAPTIKQEWWCHTPSNTWFIAKRNTLTDEVLRTYLYGQEDV